MGVSKSRHYLQKTSKNFYRELSTPFWEFPALPSDRLPSTVELYTFYSLLGVSPNLKSIQNLKRKNFQLSTPFWEFHVVSRVIDVFDNDKSDFLLPFGSFVKTEEAIELFMCLQLSTPFWEFPSTSSAPASLSFETTSFYSLLGVSSSHLPISLDLFFFASLSTPFWEFPGGGSEEGVVCPILISTFLLPFGSFLGVHKRLFHEIPYALSFYSLLGVSGSCAI